MKATIIVKMHDKFDFLFSWKEKNSLVWHHASIIAEGQQRFAVTRLDAARQYSRTSTFKTKDGKKVEIETKRWQSNIEVPVWVRDAIDWAFLKFGDRLSLGLEFTVECSDVGTIPVVTGIPEEATDTAWKRDLPQYNRPRRMTEEEQEKAKKKLQAMSKEDIIGALKALKNQ